MEKLIVRSRKDIITYCAKHDILMEDFNEPVTITSDADVEGLFNSCTSFNQPVAIPSGTIKSCRAMFFRCKSFNQRITIPVGVTNCESMFMGCTSLNQPVIIPKGVEDCNNMFTNCLSFDQEMVIPASVNNLSAMFMDCVNLNSPISILPKTDQLTKRTAHCMFKGCLNLNSQIFFEDLTTIECMFEDCISFNQSMCINGVVRNANNVFKNCMNLNSPITIYIESFEPLVVDGSNIFNKIANMFEGCELFKDKITIKIDERLLQKIIGAPKFSDIELDVI